MSNYLQGKVYYRAVVGKTVSSRSYVDGTEPRSINCSSYFTASGTGGSKYFAVCGADGDYDILSRDDSGGAKTGFSKDTRVRLRNLRFRNVGSGTDDGSQVSIEVFVAPADNMDDKAAYIWECKDYSFVRVSGVGSERVYGDLDAISVPAGSNIFVCVYARVGSGMDGFIFGDVSCVVDIDD